jgi:putative ABC transport system substrate-binding protein
MRRRALLLSAALLLGVPFAAGAQPAVVPRVGFLWDGPRGAEGQAEEGLRKGLRDLGYVEGQNIVIEYRYAEERTERLPQLVAELVRLPVSVLLTLGGPATRAAREGTSTIPIVASSGFLGELVASLTRPGGNLTGITLLQGPTETSGKWLELLKTAAPAAASVGVLFSAGRMTPASWEAYPPVGAALGLRLRRFPVARPEELDSVFEAMSRAGTDAVVVWPGGTPLALRARMAQLALRYRLAAIHEERAFAAAGGLLSYGPDVGEVWQRIASYLDRILKGARPGDLPVEHPTRLHLAVNLRTAAALGLTVPQALLARADEVIR